MTRAAIFSEDKLYRYVLTRAWDSDKKTAMCIGLNPSTANGEEDDQTISRLVKSLTALGYGGLKMVNLYGLVSKDPKVLRSHPNPWGENLGYIFIAAQGCQDVIFAWGTFKEAITPSKFWIKKFPDALCFGKTKSGAPWHPLAMMYAGIKCEDAKLERYIKILE